MEVDRKVVKVNKGLSEIEMILDHLP